MEGEGTPVQSKPFAQVVNQSIQIATAKGVKVFAAKGLSADLPIDLQLKKIASLLNKHYDEKTLADELFKASATTATHKISILEKGIQITSATKERAGSDDITETTKDLTTEGSFKETTAVKTGELVGKESVSKHYEAKFRALTGDDLKTRANQKETVSQGLDTLKAQFGEATFQKALRQMWNTPNTDISSVLQGASSDAGFGASRSMRKWLQEPGNEGLQEAVLSSLSRDINPATTKPNKVDECEEELIELISLNARRNPTYIEDGKGAYVQTFAQGTSLPAAGGAISPNTFRKDHCGYPNVVDFGNASKSDRVTQHNINMGCVMVHGEQSPEYVAVNRSGMSYTLGRLQEVVKNALLNELSTKDAKGLRKTEEKDQFGRPVLEFRHQIDSHMDLSLGKSLFSDINERTAIKQMMNALKDWPTAEHELRMTVEIDGVDRVVILKRPIVKIQPLSAVAAPSDALDLEVVTSKVETEQINFVAKQQLFTETIRLHEWSHDNSFMDELQKKSEKLANRIVQEKLAPPGAKLIKDDGLIDFDQLHAIDLFNSSGLLSKGIYGSKEYEEYRLVVDKFMLEEIKFGDDIHSLALYSVISGKSLPPGGTLVERARIELNNLETRKPSLGSELSASDLELYTNILDDQLKLSKGKQCKSGKDRTAISVALATAQARFSKNFNKIFIPDAAYRTELYGKDAADQLVLFREYFVEALEAFGYNITVESQGVQGLKLGAGLGNPVLYQYLPDHYLKKGTRREDAPYSGELENPASIFGLTDKKVTKELEKAQQEVFGGSTAFQTKKAKENVETFLKTKLGLSPNIVAQIRLSDSLELEIPLRKLGMDVLLPGTSTTVRQLIEKEIVSLTKDQGKSLSIERLKEEIAITKKNITQATTDTQKAGLASRLEQYENEITRKLQLYALRQIIELDEQRLKANRGMQKARQVTGLQLPTKIFSTTEQLLLPEEHPVVPEDIPEEKPEKVPSQPVPLKPLVPPRPLETPAITRTVDKSGKQVPIDPIKGAQAPSEQPYVEVSAKKVRKLFSKTHANPYGSVGITRRS